MTGNPEKDRELSERYGVKAYTYDDLEDALDAEQVDAVYIATPNILHREHTERTARAGAHVLCEKPMATTEEDCRAMMRAAEQNNVKLMIAYRLHFNDANLRAVELARSGELGELRYFGSLFGLQVKAGNIRVRKDLGGGTLYDIGIYCINAARYLFRDEPIEVVGLTMNNGEERFADETLELPGRNLKIRFALKNGRHHGSSQGPLRGLGRNGKVIVRRCLSKRAQLGGQVVENGQDMG